MEADLDVVDEAREKGLLVEQPLGGEVELEEDDQAMERPLDGMCQDLIMEALSCSLEERFAKFEMCRDILIDEINISLTTYVEESDQQLKEVVKGSEIGRVERRRAGTAPNVGMKRKWEGQPEPSKEPLKKRGRRSKETMGGGGVKCSEERHSERRKSLRQRVTNNGSSVSLVEEPVCKKIMPSDNDVSSMRRRDVNHNTELSGSSARLLSQEYRSSVKTLKSPFQIRCPACNHNAADAVQFEKHVDSEHGVKVGRLRVATKCCCSLHSHVCRAFAASLLNKDTKHKLERGVGGVSRPDTPEERSARAALFRHRLLLNMNHNLLCSLCIRFSNSHLVDAGEEDKIAAENKEQNQVGIEEKRQECHKGEEKQRDSEFSWECGRALKVEVEQLTDKQLKSWGVFKKGAMVPSSQEFILVNQTDRMVLGGDPHTADEKSRSDTPKDNSCKGGQRLKQLLLMEANLRRLLEQGDLVQEESESLARLKKLIKEQLPQS